MFDAADVSYAIGAYETAFRQARQSADALRTIVDEGNASGREEQLLVMALLRQSAALRKLGKARQAGEPVAEVMRRVAARTKDLNQLGNRHTHGRADRADERLSDVHSIPFPDLGPPGECRQA